MLPRRAAASEDGAVGAPLEHRSSAAADSDAWRDVSPGRLVGGIIRSMTRA